LRYWSERCVVEGSHLYGNCAVSAEFFEVGVARAKLRAAASSHCGISQPAGSEC
jgi:hypothetical protein